MRPPESRIFALITLCSALTLGACTSDDDPRPSSGKNYNTLDIFAAVFAPDDNTEPNNVLYSLRSNANAPTVLARFDKGEGQLVPLDTDTDRQGYEYALLAFEKNVHLINYDKNASNLPKPLIATEGDICAIHPMPKVDKKTVDDPERVVPIVEHQEAFFVETNAEGACSDNANSVYKVEFAFDGSQSYTITEANYAYLNGGLIVNYGVGQSFEADEDSGFWGYDHMANSLIFFDANFDPLWSTFFNTPATNAEIVQGSRDQVIIKADNEIFVISVRDVFETGVVEELNNRVPTLPASSDIRALLSAAPSLTLSSGDALEHDIIQGTRNMVVIDQFDVYTYNSESNKFDDLGIAQPIGVTDVDGFLRSSDAVLFLLKTTDSEQIVSHIDLDGGTESASILRAQRVSIFNDNNRTYINSYASLNHTFTVIEIDASLLPTTFSDSLIVAANDAREGLGNKDFYILTSAATPIEDALITPTLFRFDPEEVDGHARIIENGNLVKFTYGMLNSDVSQIAAASVLNDEYALLSTSDANGDFFNYVFEPEDEDSLRQITTITTTVQAEF
ncbi:MAG: hypothetical protein R3183_13450 [Oleiphilaceae bacterium]|nr:hypothetical protein [Oleiphilaceae bacterium]